MSNPEFAYSGLTLDELRSLAESPQVGTMQAMPHSFRALADRVGEVADLLTHAQADLPNWWKGPAAEQAAATLARAAAEAREFHDSAMGAATAVRHCAQIVAEQQNQMMRVPDVPEPGVTAVVPRPTTPFEALEAARQDATYEAAHEQAVQVVNGIAAQYVETRSRLSAVSTPRGEDFTNLLVPQPPARVNTSPYTESSPTTNRTEYNQSRRNSTGAHSIRVHEPAHGNVSTPFSMERKYHYRVEPGVTLTDGYIDSTSAHRVATPSRDYVSEQVVGAQDLPRTTDTANRTSNIDESISKAPGQLDFLDDSPSPEDTPAKIQVGEPYNRATSRLEWTEHEQASSLPTSVFYGRAAQAGLPGQQSISNTDYEGIARIGQSEPAAQSPTQTAYRSPDTANSDNTNAAMIPPYASTGSVHHARENRNPRPGYLKERKSAWLPDTVALPPDGVITPDWFEQTQ